MKKRNLQKNNLGLEKFTISKINNQKSLFGGSETNGNTTDKILRTLRPTKK